MIIDARKIAATAERKRHEAIDAAVESVSAWLDGDDGEKQLIAMAYINLAEAYHEGEVQIPEQLEDDQVQDYLLGQAVKRELDRQKSTLRLARAALPGNEYA